MAFVPYPMADGIHPEDVYLKKSMLEWPALAISSKYAQPDAAFRVLEAFLSDEVKTAASWGREVLDLDASNETAWRIIYGFMHSFRFVDSLNVRVAGIAPKMAGFSHGEYMSRFITDEIANARTEADACPV